MYLPLGFEEGNPNILVFSRFQGFDPEVLGTGRPCFGTGGVPARNRTLAWQSGASEVLQTVRLAYRTLMTFRLLSGACERINS
jgi:hypothetical protein